MEDHPGVPVFLRAFTAWAASQPDIVAVGLAGSHARGAARPDSDIDLVILSTDPAAYLNDTAWAAAFGPVARQQIEDYGLLTSVRVWYADGREVEYGWTTQAWAALPLDAGSCRVIADGFEVLYDPKQILKGAVTEAVLRKASA